MKPEDRWYSHCWYLEHNKHRNRKLQSSWNKYGKDVWSFSVVETCDSLSQLNEREEQLIKEWNTVNNGYNIRPGGQNSLLSDEHKKLISKTLRGHAVTEETRRKLSKSHKGQQHSLGYKQSESHIEQRRKQRLKVYDGFISPHGEVFRDIVDLPTFCRERRLTLGNMRMVDWGMRNHHKGWTKYVNH